MIRFPHGAMLVACGVLLVGCGTAPVATVPAAPSVSPSESVSPTVPPGPTLTKAQFEVLVKAGKLGDRKISLKPASPSSGSDPDHEGEENQQQSEAVSCVKMNKLADANVLALAADDPGAAVVQLFSSSAVAGQLFELNKRCAAEQAKLDPGTAVTSVSSGTAGSASWWLIKDPMASYQVTIVDGNLIVYAGADNADDPTAFVAAVGSQLEEIAKH